jgi:hypothetical protein
MKDVPRQDQQNLVVKVKIIMCAGSSAVQGRGCYHLSSEHVGEAL